MKKRILSLIICAVMSLSLCACSDIDDNTNNPGNNNDSTQITTVPDVQTPSDEQTPSDQTSVGTDNSQPTPVEPAKRPDWKYDFSSSFIDDNGIEYIWDQLDENTRINLGEVMNAINDVVLYCPLSVGFPREEANDFLSLVTNCSMFYTWRGKSFKTHADDNGMIKGLTIRYRIDYEEEAMNQAQSVEAKLKEVVSKMPDGSDFEKIKYLHDWLVLNCAYSDDAVSPFSAYGALVEGQAACQGYADAMLLLLDRAGFEVAFATGEGRNTSVTHKWVYVKCSDGKWYILDPTWDDPQNISDDDFDPDYIIYNYFLISDEELLKDHAKKYDSIYYKTPVADSMDMNFHKVMGYWTNNADEAYDILEKQVLEAAKEGKRYVYLRADDPKTMKSIYEDIAKGSTSNNKLVKILTKAKETANAKVVTAKWSKALSEKTGTLILTLNYDE